MIRLIMILVIIGFVPVASAYHYYPWYQGSWDHIPTICILMDSEAKQHQYKIIRGVQLWQDEIKKRYADHIPILTKQSDRCDVNVWFDSNMPYRISTPDVFGATQCYENKGHMKICNVQVNIGNTGTKKLSQVVSHEIGHTLGFGHVQPIKMGALPALVQENDIMLQGVNHFRIITPGFWDAFEQKYGRDGFTGWNNYTSGKYIIRH